MEKLTIEHLAPYLPYKLGVEILNYRSDYVGLQYSSLTGYYLIEEDPHFTYIGGSTGKSFRELKPILRPLSDFLDINSDAMNDLNCDIQSQINIMDLAYKIIGLSSLSYTDAQLCFRSHVDVFGLIEKGLAIDINILTKPNH